MSAAVNLQTFIGKVEDAVSNVDLLKIGQQYVQNAEEPTSKNNNNKKQIKYRIALDMEHCLDRFYGGYYSDWACGGQWNRALQFVQLLANAFNAAQIEMFIFFDGTHKSNKILQLEQSGVRDKVLSVLKHVRVIGTPPPKIWWLPPAGTKIFLRNALRSINIQVMQTVNDHTGEIIDYFHEHKLHAVMGLNSDYIFSNVNQYFSSHDLRLSYKGQLETKEYKTQNLLKSLDIQADHLPYLAIFLNHQPNKNNMIDEPTLRKLYEKLYIEFNADFETRLKKFVELFKKNPSFGDNIDEFIEIHNLCDNKKIIKDCFNYYQSKYKYCKKTNNMNNIMKNNQKKVLANGVAAAVTVEQVDTKSKTGTKSPPAETIGKSDAKCTTPDSDTLKEVIETPNDEKVELPDMKCDETSSNAAVLEQKLEKTASAESTETKVDATEVKVNNKVKNTKKEGEVKSGFVYTLPVEVIKTALNRHQRGIMDSRIYHLLQKKEIVLSQVLEDEQYRDVPSINQFYRPARQMIYATLFNLYHQKYLCSKNNHHQQSSTANHNTKKSMNATGKNGPHDEKSKNFIPEVKIKEWIWRPQNDYKSCEVVNAVSLQWAVPTVQRLWFGLNMEDKQRRMKAFLTIMRSDSPLMLNRSYVPQHMLVMACVLRYIITCPDRSILTRTELDAFLATAFSLQLNNVEYTQELTVPGVNVRGVFLASLFMVGVETASLANDACGVPLPWIMTNPWLFFDGKLFHLKLKMAAYVQNLRELCDDQIEIALKVDRFRKAILEGLDMNVMQNQQDLLYRQAAFVQSNLAQQFTKQYQTLSNIPTGNYFPNSSSSQANYYSQQQQQQQQPTLHLTRDGTYITRNPKLFNHQTGRNHNYSRIGSGGAIQGIHNRGYQLKVGGIVVGSWADGVTNNKSMNTHQRKIMNLTRNAKYPMQRGRASFGNRSINRPGIGGGVALQVGARWSHGRNVGSTGRNRNRKNKKKTQTTKKDTTNKLSTAVGVAATTNTTATKENKESDEKVPKAIQEKPKITSSDGMQNGTSKTTITTILTTVLAPDQLVNSICAEILKDEPQPDSDCNDEAETPALKDVLIKSEKSSTHNSPTNDPKVKDPASLNWQQPLVKNIETAIEGSG